MSGLLEAEFAGIVQRASVRKRHCTTRFDPTLRTYGVQGPLKHHSVIYVTARAVVWLGV